MVDGPFGSPSSNIYRAEHAVLIGTGIGVTPFASILQSIAFRNGTIRRVVSRNDCDDLFQVQTSKEELSQVPSLLGR